MKWRIFSEYTSALFLLSYMGLIFYLSSIPGSELKVETPDYILHALAFGGFYFFSTLFLLHQMKLKQSLLSGLFFTFLFALSDEAHQYFVPGRTPDLRDIAADLVGALFVLVMLIFIFRFYAFVKSKKG
ncbi:VanZ family protein [Anoxybacter fermentans]|nr:VanZ family protein [Anoxybacter fermentans]